MSGLNIASKCQKYLFFISITRLQNRAHQRNPPELAECKKMKQVSEAIINRGALGIIGQYRIMESINQLDQFPQNPNSH
jgi:hypothetical protein